MDYIGKIRDLSRSMGGDIILTLELEDNAVEMDSLTDKRLRIKLTEYKQKRSLDANAMLWSCLGDMAKAMSPPVDKWDMYLMELKKYGKYTYILMDEKAVDAFRRMWRETEVIGDVNVNGRTAKQMLCYYGSSTYDSKEFSVLLDGVIQDMRDLGLQPPPSRDIQSALIEWEKQHKKKGDE